MQPAGIHPFKILNLERIVVDSAVDQETGSLVLLDYGNEISVLGAEGAERWKWTEMKKAKISTLGVEGGSIVIGRDDGLLEIITNGKLETEIWCDAEICSYAISKQIIAIGLRKGKLMFYDTTKSDFIAAVDDIHQDDVTAIKFSKNNPTKVIVGSAEGCLCLYDLSAKDMDDALETIINLENEISEIGWIGDDDLKCYCVTNGNKLLICDLDRAEVDKSIPLQGVEEDFKVFLGVFMAADKTVNYMTVRGKDIIVCDIDGKTKAVFNSTHSQRIRGAGLFLDTFFSYADDRKLMFYKGCASQIYPPVEEISEVEAMLQESVITTDIPVGKAKFRKF